MRLIAVFAALLSIYSASAVANEIACVALNEGSKGREEWTNWKRVGILFENGHVMKNKFGGDLKLKPEQRYGVFVWSGNNVFLEMPSWNLPSLATNTKDHRGRKWQIKKHSRGARGC